MSTHELFGLVDRAQVLSLDVFDTALLREVSEPAEVFDLVERQARHDQGPLPRFDFRAERIAAEQRAREAAWRSERRRDIRFDEIYAALAVPHGWDVRSLERVSLDDPRALSGGDEA